VLLFVEGPDKAGKSTFIKNLVEDFDFVPFTMPYPKDLATQVDLSHYFLGANTFLLEIYKSLDRVSAFDMVVHRSLVSEYAYGPEFGRQLGIVELCWWLKQWPKDTAFVWIDISHDVYLKRLRNAPADQLSLRDEEVWGRIIWRYQCARGIIQQEGKCSLFVDGTANFETQFESIRMMLPWDSDKR